ncbi:MAG: family transcriptional regulator [Amycolatopsis sp.]|uniref:helix-turn-helix domain-containing protein n=1 Tax=Amycolatopsis sp. TaxID=37632 RepID=UPI00260F95CA|nr:helix-turn-helix transcriptional regulator [Amycolatopsis sp.]MCU1685132.1 family transcriptional regulator [Amycolatopsis sp.]
MTSSVPVISVATQRKSLGILVRQARTRYDITQAALGALIGCKQSKVNKIETGKCGTKSADLDNIVVALAIDPATAAQMRALNVRSTPARARSEERAATPSWFFAVIERERDATEMFSWTGERIPGLLQSEYYMLTQFHASGASNVTALVSQRSARQRIFANNPAGHYEFLLSEGAVDRMVRSLKPATALDQLDHILNLMKRYPCISIRVVPYSAAPYVDPDFTILRFAEDTLDFAYTESVTGLTTTAGAELHKYDEAQDALRYLALPVDATADLFTEHARRLGGILSL